MLYKTYISKFSTIIENSDLNIGINPIAELNFGRAITRCLFYFDCSKLKEMYCSNITPNLSKFKHTLRITNCGSIDFTQLHCGRFSDIDDSIQLRASSFDVLFFLIPQEWDGGKGFDYKYTFFNQGYFTNDCSSALSKTEKLISTDGVNWFQARNGYDWEEEGIYSIDTLSKEYDKFAVGESNIIIGRKHFDIGNENIDLDITDIVNKFILDEIPNYGIGMCFSPLFENIEDMVNSYVGFFTHKTPSFFEPFVESKYEDYISDDRSNFILDKINRLYLYCNIGGNPTDLDVMPICTIDNKDYKVVHQFKGIYYAELTLPYSEYKPNTMLYDTWSNIVYQGNRLDDVELDFTLKQSNNWFNIGSTTNDYPRYVPNISGIKNEEKINRGDVRKLTIIARIPYDINKAALVNNMELRLYVLDGEREIDVIPYDHVNKGFSENFYMLDTNMLIPQEYHVDIRLRYNGELIVRKDILKFHIVNNLNNKYY